MDNVVGVWGNFQTIVLRDDNTLWGQGSNTYGQLAGGIEMGRHSFTREYVHLMDNVISASAGFNHTVALRADGSVLAWGGNSRGQVGYDSPSQIGTGMWTRVSYPIRIMDDVVAIAAGGQKTFAIRSDGSLWGWGNNEFGQMLCNVSGVSVRNPIHIMDNVAAVSAGGTSVAVIRVDGSLWTWGWRFGDAFPGDGTRTAPRVPVHVMDDVVAVDMLHRVCFAVRNDGSLWGWGFGGNAGILGDGVANSTHLSPILIMENVVAASVGNNHALAIDTNGRVWAWGANHVGQLGDGTTSIRHYPAPVIFR